MTLAKSLGATPPKNQLGYEFDLCILELPTAQGSSLSNSGFPSSSHDTLHAEPLKLTDKPRKLCVRRKTAQHLIRLFTRQPNFYPSFNVPLTIYYRVHLFLTACPTPPHLNI